MQPAQQLNGLGAESPAAVPAGYFHELDFQPGTGFRDPVSGINLGGSTTIRRTTSSPARVML